MTSPGAGLAVLEVIARQQGCRRCGYPPSAHWHYRDTPSATRACSRYRPRKRKIVFWRFR